MRTIAIGVALCAALLLPSPAFAATTTPTASPNEVAAKVKASKASTASAGATATAAPNAKTRTYDLDFTLPTAGKSGCQVCHADPNLVKPSGETTKSIYVDPASIAKTAHKDTPCSGCHIDFAYKTPHQNVKDGSDWRSVAGTACKNCHDNVYSQVAMGAHSPANKPGEDASATAAARRKAGKPVEVPTCGGCHGSHDIDYLDVARVEASGTVEAVAAAKAGRAKMHGKGLEICGQCHKDYADSYRDYYHGAAYREGAADAPACWDCHGAHEMLPTSDLRSPVNEANLAETCGKVGCHANVKDEQFVAYAKLIHGKGKVLEANILWTFYETARTQIKGMIDAVASWF